MKACRFSSAEEAKAAFALGVVRYVCAVCGRTHTKGNPGGPCRKQLASELGAGLRTRHVLHPVLDWNLPLGEFGFRDEWWLEARVRDGRERAHEVTRRLGGAARKYGTERFSEYEWVLALEPATYRDEVKRLREQAVDVARVRKALELARGIVAELRPAGPALFPAGWYRREGSEVLFRPPGGAWGALRECCVRLPSPSELTGCGYVGDDWTPPVAVLRAGRECVAGATPSALLFGWDGLAGMWLRRVVAPEDAALLAGEPHEPEFWSFLF